MKRNTGSFKRYSILSNNKKTKSVDKQDNLNLSIQQNCMPAIKKFRERLDQQMKKRKNIQKVIFQKQDFYYQVGKEWFKKGLQNAVVKHMFQKKQKQGFIKNFSKYLYLILKGDSQASLTELRNIHTFGLPSLIFSDAKIILCLILIQLQPQRINANKLIVYSSRMQSIRLCVAQINQFFAVHPLQKISKQMQIRFPNRKQFFYQLLLYFLFHCKNLQPLHQYIKLNRIRYSHYNFLMIKIYLIKKCYFQGIPIGIVKRLVNNLRYVKLLLIQGITLTDYIIEIFGSIQRFIQKIQKSLIFFKEYSDLLIIPQFLLNVVFIDNQYTYSFKETYQIIKQSLIKSELQKLFFQLLNYCKKIFDPPFTSFIKETLKQFLQLFKQRVTNYQQIKSSQQNVQHYALNFAKNQNFLCSYRSIALLTYNQNLYTRQELIMLHSSVNRGNFRLIKLCAQNDERYEGLKILTDKYFNDIR